MARIHVPAQFDPWRVQAVTHELSSHPLLQIEALVELGKRQEARKLVRSHNDTATAGTSFIDAPDSHPNRQTAAETLSRIADAKAWMSLLNVQADPVYRALIDEILDEIKPRIEAVDPGMCYRAGWIFVSSPGAVTPFHIDHEHNFIVQIRGKKRLYTWDPFDRVVVSERGQELFHSMGSRDEVVWREDHRARARVFDLEPGQGGYMPSTTPHMVENGAEPSITMSFTYYTDSTRRRELLYIGNARLRRLGLKPTPVGQSPAEDAAKTALFRAYEKTRETVARLQKKSFRRKDLPYAPA